MTDVVQLSLRPVGRALIIVGLLDIVLMIYCIMTSQAYVSSFNVFAVIAGILLVRGHLKTARAVAHASAFSIAVTVTAIALCPIVLPVAYVATCFRVEPWLAITAVMMGLLLIAFSWWTHRRLTSQPLMVAFQTANVKPPRPFWPAFAGIAMMVGLITLFQFAKNTEVARLTLEKAMQEHGDHQKYFLTSLHSSTSAGKLTIQATVIGYTERTMTTYEVSWGG